MQGLRSRLETTSNGEAADELKKLISVSLRPNDPFAKRLLSTPVTTNNLLLKVTVPKRTGRKRKRGTTGPFLAEDDHVGASDASSAGRTNNNCVEAADIYRTLQDNESKYQVAFAGVVYETQRFRGKHGVRLSSGYSY